MLVKIKLCGLKMSTTARSKTYFLGQGQSVQINDVHPKFTGLLPTPNGWYLEQVISGEMDVFSDPNHPATLTDHNGHPVKVWRDAQSGRLNIVRV